MNRVWVATFASASLITLALGGATDVGFSVSVSNGEGLVSAGTSVLHLLVAALIGVAYGIALEPAPRQRSGSPASVTRRVTAWLLDCVLALIALSAVVALLPLAIEAFATGHFRWGFRRTEVATTDWLVGLLGVAIVFVGLAGYWALPIARGAQTIGQNLVGIRAVVMDSTSTTLRRYWVYGFMEVFAPLAWASRIFGGGRRPGRLLAFETIRLLPWQPPN